MNPDQVGLLILRVWIEPGSIRPARLQLRATTDPSTGFTRTQTLAGIEEAITVIRAFLQSILPDDPGDSHHTGDPNDTRPLPPAPRPREPRRV